MAKSCKDCRKRVWDNYGFPEYCIKYEMYPDPAETCTEYEERTEEEDRCPSSTMRDYGPSNPWDAPGMSIRDFI